MLATIAAFLGAAFGAACSDTVRGWAAVIKSKVGK